MVLFLGILKHAPHKFLTEGENKGFALNVVCPSLCKEAIFVICLGYKKFK